MEGQAVIWPLTAFRSWEERDIAQRVDLLFPLFPRLVGWVDVLDSLLVHLLDGIRDPAALNLD